MLTVWYLPNKRAQAYLLAHDPKDMDLGTLQSLGQALGQSGRRDKEDLRARLINIRDQLRSN